MGTAWGPSHLLLFDQPLGDELVDRRFHKARRNTFSASLTLPVVDWRPDCPAAVRSPPDRSNRAPRTGQRSRALGERAAPMSGRPSMLVRKVPLTYRSAFKARL